MKFCLLSLTLERNSQVSVQTSPERYTGRNLRIPFLDVFRCGMYTRTSLSQYHMTIPPL